MRGAREMRSRSKSVARGREAKKMCLALCRGIEPRSPAHHDMTGGCTNQYTNKDMLVLVIY
jgi:hypothetical protein